MAKHCFDIVREVLKDHGVSSKDTAIIIRDYRENGVQKMAQRNTKVEKEAAR